MTTRSIGSSYRLKDGKVIKSQPRQPAGQARNQRMKTARLAKKWAERSKTK
jgi:hypothetical protein